MLLQKTYRPHPSVKLHLPKANGTLRPITLLCVPDQIVYQAIANVIATRVRSRLTKNYNKLVFGNQIQIYDTIYFYQKWNKGYRKWQEEIRLAYASGYPYLANFDLASFFDILDHQVLRQVLERQLRTSNSPVIDLLINCLIEWTATDADIHHSHGIPQGPLPSSFFSELVLDYVDRLVGPTKGVRYLRYADDISLLSNNERNLRVTLRDLDLAVKDLALVPQGAKIKLRRVENIEKEIKVFYANTFPNQSVGVDSAKRVTRRMSALLNRAKKSGALEISRFKYFVYRMYPDGRVLLRLVKLIPLYPELGVDILTAVEKSEKISDAISKLFLTYIKSDPVYDSIHARIWRIVSKNPNVYLIGEVIHLLKLRTKQSKRFNAELRKELFLAKQRLNPNTNDFRRIISKENSWWVRTHIAEFISQLPVDKSIPLLDKMITDDVPDVGLVCAWLRPWSIKRTFRVSDLDPFVHSALFHLGVISRKNMRICPIAMHMQWMFNFKNTFDWRKLLGHQYKQAGKLIGFAYGYYQNDPTAWVTQIDGFNDILVKAVIKKDKRLVMPKWKKGRRVDFGKLLDLSDPTMPGKNIKANFPTLYNAVFECHKKRGEAHLAHPITYRTNRATKEISFSARTRLAKRLSRGYAEIVHNLQF